MISKIGKVNEWFITPANIVFALGLMAIVGLALDRTPPVQISKVEVAPVMVSGGQDIFIKFTSTRARVCESSADPYIFDGAGTRWEYPRIPYRINNDVIGEDIVTVRRTIPINVAAGNAKYRVVIYQRCRWNPFHWIYPIVDAPDDASFIIIDRE